MKKFLFMAGVLTYMAAVGMETAHAQQTGLGPAIQRAASAISPHIGRDARVAILSMEAESTRMSDHLIDEMIVAFLRIGGFTVVDRARVDLVEQELDFRMSHEVNDTAAQPIAGGDWASRSYVRLRWPAQSIGRFMDVQYIVTGTLEPIGGSFRLRVWLIEVETAAIRIMHAANVQHDSVIAFLFDTHGVRQARAPRAPDQDRVNWISLEWVGLGVGISYMRDINNWFSIGGTAWVDANVMLFYGDGFSVGARATARFFPGGFPFFMELGLGFGYAEWWWDEQVWRPGGGWGGSGYWGWEWRRRSAFGIVIAPTIGVRLGGRTRGFFVSPSVGYTFVIGDGDVAVPRFGSSIGWAW